MMINVIGVRAQPRTSEIVVRLSTEPSYAVWDALYAAFNDVLVVTPIKDAPLSGSTFLIRTTLRPQELGLLDRLRQNIGEWLGNYEGQEERASDLTLTSSEG